MYKELMNLEYPKNLVAVVYGEEFKEYPEDFEASVQYILYELKEDQRKILEYLFRDRLTLNETAKKLTLTVDGVRSKKCTALRTIAHPKRFRIMRYGVKKWHELEVERIEEYYEKEIEIKKSNLNDKKEMSFTEIEFSARDLNCISSAIKPWKMNRSYQDITIGEIIEIVNNGKLRDTRNCGVVTMKSIISKLCDFGMEDCIDKEVKDVYFE